MDDRLVALNRFGLGATLGERARIDDASAWLRRQIEDPPAASLDADVWGADLPTLKAAASHVTALRAAQRSRDQEAAAAARAEVNELRSSEVLAVLDQRLRSEAPFVERLVAFWSNHLCVSTAAKIQVAATAGHYERSAIRPHVLGRFEEMVLASARHPAMLFYLDNFQSIGPDSRAGRRSARGRNPRGLNENYARELLELHTLGVDGGYGQQDVEELARMLTGWTVRGIGPGGREDADFGFVFRPEVHQPGSKTVLGRQYGEQGIEEAESVIRSMCRHPSTARFVSTKLVRHFVSDDPPDSAVQRLERVFLETEGDLSAVAAELIETEEAWRPTHRKFRSPQEWLVAVFRSVGVTDAPPPLPRMLRQLRHTPWAPPSPKGYGDTRGEWSDPDALMNRAELARTLAGQAFRGRSARERRWDPAALLDVVSTDDLALLRDVVSDTGLPAEDRLALIIGGPAFQWR